MPRTLLLTGLRDLLRRPLPTALLVAGIALGVAVVVAIDLASSAARQGFERGARALFGRATHVVRGGPAGVPEDWLRRLRIELGLRSAAPVVEDVAIALDLDRQPVRLLGVDPLADTPVRDHLAGGSLLSPGFERLFLEPGVVVGAAAADRHGLRPGSPLRLQVGDRVVEVPVLGVVRPADVRDADSLDGIVLLDVGQAQRLLGRTGRLSRIDLVATPDQAARVAAALPPGLLLSPASEQAETARQLTAAFDLNLRALSLLALVVGVFLVYNTVLFGVVQRRPVFATLRLLGATPGQVAGLVLAEAAAAGALGGVLGLPLGFGLGQAALRLVARTVNDLYDVVAVTAAPPSPVSLAVGLALGVGASLLAALEPALEAARVEPVDALRPSELVIRARRAVPRLAAAGALLLTAGIALLALATTSLPLSFAGLFGLLLGLALLAPLGTVLLMRPAAAALGACSGALGRMAARSVAVAISRTGVAVAALMVAVSVTIGVSLMIRGFRATVENWLDLTLRADIYVSAPTPGGTRATPTLSPDTLERVRAVPGVGDVETFRSVRVAGPGGEVQVGVADPRHGRSAALYRLAEGGPERAWARLAEGAVLVSEPFAHRHPGPSVRLQTDRGPHDFPVAGVFYDYSTEAGLVLIARPVYERFWDDRGISSLGVALAPGSSLEDVTAALRAALGGTALQVTPNRRLRELALRVFDRTFAVTQALRLLAVVVAFIGVWSALLALQVERTRELATLLALGLGPAQLVRLMLLETGLMGACAGLFSLPTGVALAVALVKVINVRSFGWSMRLEIDPAVLAQALAVSVGAALLAAIYPALRLLRRPLAGALRQE